MKLNLIPTYVSKEGQSKAFIILGVLLLLLSGAAAYGMVKISTDAADQALQNATDNQKAAADAVAMGKFADVVIAQATGIDKNIKLARAMNTHSAVYPNLYDEVLSYVPSFLRVTNISAAAGGPDNVTVQLTGVLSTFQQYADANLALLRIPGVQNVVRSNYAINDRQVPNLNQGDQIGAPVKPGEANLPSDPMERLDEMVARAQTSTHVFQDLNGFGNPDATSKGAGPNASLVSFTITMSGKNLQAPDPRGTIMARGGTAPTPGR